MKTLNFLHKVVAALVFGSVAAAATATNLEKGRLDEATRWADSVYNTLTERQRVAQSVFPTINPQDGAASKALVRRMVETQGCGGLLFSKGTLEEYRDIIEYAQAVAKVPLLITFDGEWGLSMRIADTPRFPKNMALGAITDYRLIYEYGREMARECRLLGVNVNFAPDADVNSNPSNPVIGVRSFGEDPSRVGDAVVAYSLGLEDGGVQAVAKHFPGHGDTDTDSHKSLPAVNRSRAGLDSIEFVPFGKFIDAGCSGVMVGHLSVPALDASGTPSSMSRQIVTGSLREGFNFTGLVYTDALGMRGAVDPKGRNSSVAAYEAGNDVLLNPLYPGKDIDAIMAAINSGKIKKEDVETHCKRVLRYKYLVKAWEKPYGGTIGRLRELINSPQAEALVQKLADASITLLKNKDNLLPVSKLTGKKAAVINLGARSGNTFMNTCEFYMPVESHYSLGEAFSKASLEKINANDIVIVGVYDDKAATQSAFARIVESATKPVVGVFMLSPYKLSKFAKSLPSLSALVMAYEDIKPAQQAAAEAIFGGIDVTGVLPVNLRGIATAGTGIRIAKNRLGFTSPVAEGMAPWLTDSLNTVLTKALKAGAFPGCQVLVARNGNVVYDRSFGRLSTVPTSAKVNNLTSYDLASVSKATGTLSGIMKIYDQGKLNLDATLGQLIPELTDTAKQGITVRQLLYHQSGMPATVNVFDIAADPDSYTGRLFTSRSDKNHTIKLYNRTYGNNSMRLRTDILGKERSEKFPVEAAKGLFTGKITYDTIMRRIYDIPLRSRSYRYSCLNFCLLMDIEQRLNNGKPHDEFVYEEIFGPLGAYRTAYRPTTNIGADNVPPTENDKFLRRQILQGYVHDELANLSGGVQGNAGLFANAGDIAKYCQMLINGGSYGDARIISPETAQLFLTDKSATCRRGLGFDKPDVDNPDNSPTCEEASAAVVGHLGYTGTVFWVDPTENLIFIFLTNRVNPTRDSAVFNRMNIRPHLFSIVNRAIEK
ncbi:MAG: serine hydrolase [Muribaculaceae bacterium]|jgi:beta-glucosidase-like glycosyl hydrolase/CubicO group peptidase (beta-lactamase class C family)|nr:serine hydrolase [Muribaculaceae bacterium]